MADGLKVPIKSGEGHSNVVVSGKTMKYEFMVKMA